MSASQRTSYSERHRRSQLCGVKLAVEFLRLMRFQFTEADEAAGFCPATNSTLAICADACADAADSLVLGIALDRFFNAWSKNGGAL